MALIIGFALAILIAALIGGFAVNLMSLARWLHIVAGVFWIGLLYYFNAVQTPAMAVAAADKGGPGGAGINKYIAPRALLWFRWSALATWLMGPGCCPRRMVASSILSPSDCCRPRCPIRTSSWVSAPGWAPSCCSMYGHHLAQPTKDLGDQACDRRTKSRRAQGGLVRLPH